MHEHGWPVTFSIGVTSHDVTPRDFDGALAQADALMYEVKNGARNRILQRVFHLQNRELSRVGWDAIRLATKVWSWLAPVTVMAELSMALVSACKPNHCAK